jgi:phosphoribosylformimino-5-aminoimidazole carboxamide ribotide isomerase
MRVIGVLDLFSGRAVHAGAGTRPNYEPVRSVAGLPLESNDAVTLAHVYIDRLGLSELYIADLDAIFGGKWHEKLIKKVVQLGVPLWLDGGISSVDGARRALDLGVAQIVVGLETLPSYNVLEAICFAVGGDRVAFSLDLRDGRPMIADVMADFTVGSREGAAPVIATRAADAGVGALIVLDLARVGSGAGVDLELMARVREAASRVVLLAGGGVRHLDELLRLANCGCDGALVATALHKGQLSAADVAAARNYPRQIR